MGKSLRPVNDVAKTQLGLITFDQMVSLRFTEDETRTFLRNGFFLRIRRGVYVVGGAPPTFEQTVLAAQLAAGTTTVVSHLTAARLWAFPKIEWPEGIELTVPVGKRVRLEGVVSHEARCLLEPHCRSKGPLLVTTPARTIVDIVGRVRNDVLRAALHDGRRRSLYSYEDVGEILRQTGGRGRRRSVELKTILKMVLPGQDLDESDLEERVLRALAAAGLPLPVLQYRIVLRGRKRRIDICYPDLKIAIECDGWDAHKIRPIFDDDRIKTADLVALKWIVIPITSAATDEDIVRWVGSAIAQRSSALASS